MSPKPVQIRLDQSDATPAGSRWHFSAGPVRQTLLHDPQTGHSNLVSIDPKTAEQTVQQTWADPLAALAWMAGDRVAGCRWIGFISYELGRRFENLPRLAGRSGPMPLFRFSLHDSAGAARLSPRSDAASLVIERTFSRDGYLRAVRRVLDYISAGDVFQINLSQRISVRTARSADSIYAQLQAQSPAAYAGLLDWGDLAVVSNSPELFLQVTADRTIRTRPIKGTRPLASGMKQALEMSEKDQAELNMIVDLERNDLGRVCQRGSVRVAQRRTIETHPTVYHGVAEVEGTLRADVGLVELLRATFPGGSVTGAPKIRAMQIIDELEPEPRNVYCGAIGYLDADGSMEFNLAIRTITLQNQLAQVYVGGGIVADSIPAEEYDETLVKARAMFAALGLRSDDLDVSHADVRR